VKYLLDTQVFLWYVADSRKLPSGARQRIADAEEVFVSAASIWEASIKAAIGKLDVDVEVLAGEIEGNGFAELPVTARHAAGVAALPRHHGDPFDRLLIAQAMHEPLHLLTSDAALVAYSELVIAIS